MEVGFCQTASGATATDMECSHFNDGYVGKFSLECSNGAMSVTSGTCTAIDTGNDCQSGTLTINASKGDGSDPGTTVDVPYNSVANGEQSEFITCPTGYYGEIKVECTSTTASLVNDDNVFCNVIEPCDASTAGSEVLIPIDYGDEPSATIEKLDYLGGTSIVSCDYDTLSDSHSSGYGNNRDKYYMPHGNITASCVLPPGNPSTATSGVYAFDGECADTTCDDNIYPTEAMISTPYILLMASCISFATMSFLADVFVIKCCTETHLSVAEIISTKVMLTNPYIIVFQVVKEWSHFVFIIANVSSSFPNFSGWKKYQLIYARFLGGGYATVLSAIILQLTVGVIEDRIRIEAAGQKKRKEKYGTCENAKCPGKLFIPPQQVLHKEKDGIVNFCAKCNNI
eukprot:UN33105